ncbi:MAG TPA: hypothetical protein VIM73_02430, partial [Polyangiaceae bacterium]
ALAPLLFGNFAQAAGWIVLVERMAAKAVPRPPAVSLYLDSQLARYAPGKVGLPLVRMEGAPRLGLTRGLVGVSVIIESLSWPATGAVVAFFLLSVLDTPREGLGALSGPWDLPILVAALAGVVVLVAVDRRRVPKKLLSLLSLQGTGPLTPFALPLGQLAFWIGWVVHGYVLALALGATPAGALSVVAFVPLANVLGFMALAAPAGVGVREAVLIYGLAPVLGGPGALAFAVLSRVLSLISDVTVWLGARAFTRRAALATRP